MRTNFPKSSYDFIFAGNFYIKPQYFSFSYKSSSKYGSLANSLASSVVCSAWEFVRWP